MAPQLAWIGLGNMGRGMSKNLVQKGSLNHPLIIYNRTKKRAEDHANELGAGQSKVASSIHEAVSAADIIFICLGDDQSVKENIHLALQIDVSGKLFVDCSTIHPDSSDALGESIIAKGAHFVACPVFGAPAMANTGQLLAVLAGPKADVERVRPYMQGVMARAELDFSDQPYGKASLMKIVGNTFILQMVEALSEGHTLAEKSGLGQKNLHSFLETMMPGPYVAYSNRMMQGDYYKRDEPLFQVDLARKDAKHAMDLAQHYGAKVKAVEVVDLHLQAVKDRMGEKGDLAGVYGAVRLESGLKFENQ